MPKMSTKEYPRLVIIHHFCVVQVAKSNFSLYLFSSNSVFFVWISYCFNKGNVGDTNFEFVHIAFKCVYVFICFKCVRCMNDVMNWAYMKNWVEHEHKTPII